MHAKYGIRSGLTPVQSCGPEEFDVNQDSAVDAAEIAAVAQSTALDNTPAEQGMTNRVAEILVRMVDSDNDRLITAAELQAYNAKKG